MTTHRPLPSLDYLRTILRYNPHTGDLYRFRKTKAVWVKLSTPSKCRISIDNQQYACARLAFLLHTGTDPGPLMIDHINGRDSDHRAVNLRAVTASQNAQNRRTTARSGHKGIYVEKSGRFCVQVCRTQGRGEVGVHGSRDGFKRKTWNLFASWCLKECKDFYIDYVYSNDLAEYCRPVDLEPITSCSCGKCKAEQVKADQDAAQAIVSVTLPMALPNDPKDLKPRGNWLNDLINAQGA